MVTLDVDVVDLGVVGLVLDTLDHVEPAGINRHDHAATDAGRRDEGQRLLEHVPLKDVAAIEPLANGACNRHQFAEVGAHGLEAPARPICLGGPDTEAHGVKDRAILCGHAYHGDTMHRCAAAPV